MKHEVEQSLVAVERTPAGCRASFLFAPDLTVFRGHFPGFPIVPGVFLIEGTRVCVDRVLNRTHRIIEVKEARFTVQINPGDPVVMDAVFTIKDDTVAVNAKFECLGVRVAEVRVVLGS